MLSREDINIKILIKNFLKSILKPNITIKTIFFLKKLKKENKFKLIIKIRNQKCYKKKSRIGIPILEVV